MNPSTAPATTRGVDLIEERYGWAFLASAGVHALAAFLVVLMPFLGPAPAAIQLGTGPGGGGGSESYSVGIADDPGGGAGLVKPATSPQPPVLPQEPAPRPAKKDEETASKAVPLPEPYAAKAKRKPPAPPAKTGKNVPATKSPVIPVADAKGTGKEGSAQGSQGGTGTGGVGISLGSGSGGIGDSWYARAVEARISQGWNQPVGVREPIEIVYSFFVADNGRIYNIKLEKSSGNPMLDLSAERAITGANPLTEPPPQLRGRLLQFTCQFIYPPK
jgi:TonB family protein